MEESKELLSKTMKQNETVQEELAKRTVELQEMKELAQQRQRVAEQMATELAKYGVKKAMHNFEHANAREVGAGGKENSIDAVSMKLPAEPSSIGVPSLMPILTNASAGSSAETASASSSAIDTSLLSVVSKYSQGSMQMDSSHLDYARSFKASGVASSSLVA